MDNTVIKSQLTTLKRRVKAQKAVAANSEVADLKESRDGQESLTDPPTENTVPSEIDLADQNPDDGISAHFSKINMNSTSVPEPSNNTIIKWSCQECSNECIPVMRESRCLCGHRLKEHKASSSGKPSFPCSSRGCRCKHFFFLVAEGAWILRCRCKHKHIEHDCGPGSHKCGKCKECSGFDSPWVCNCGHTWSSHKQHTIKVTENNAEVVLGVQPNKKQHFYRQDGLEG